MRQLGRRVENNAPAIARKAALAIDQVVVLATPVDTGRARSNWQVGIGGNDAPPRDSLAPGEKGSTGAAAAQAAIAEGKAVIESYKGGSSIYISNNLPYIGRLNDGYSAQAPAGFVEQAVQSGVAAVRGAKILRERP